MLTGEIFALQRVQATCDAAALPTFRRQRLCPGENSGSALMAQLPTQAPTTEGKAFILPFPLNEEVNRVCPEHSRRDLAVLPAGSQHKPHQPPEPRQRHRSLLTPHQPPGRGQDFSSIPTATAQPSPPQRTDPGHVIRTRFTTAQGVVSS